jgi:deazaflavin-dependent oxidoreductase (nitroreductase family)
LNVSTERCGAEGDEMDPQDYSARVDYRPNAQWYERLNHLGVAMTWLGLAPRDAITLEVRGRASGKPRRLPILRTPYKGDDYLVSLAGESQWVRNVRAASGQAIIRRRGTHRVHLEEVAPGDRAGVIAQYLRRAEERGSAESAAKQARFYFGLDPDPSFDEIKAVVDYYPVFRIAYER